jgi:hypothetical protein
MAARAEPEARSQKPEARSQRDIHFTDGLHPALRAREIFHFFQPETLAQFALKDLLQGVALSHRGDDMRLSLANWLVRLVKQLDDKALKRIEQANGA